MSELGPIDLQKRKSEFKSYCQRVERLPAVERTGVMLAQRQFEFRHRGANVGRGRIGGSRVSFAHCIYLRPDEMELIAERR